MEDLLIKFASNEAQLSAEVELQKEGGNSCKRGLKPLILGS